MQHTRILPPEAFSAPSRLFGTLTPPTPFLRVLSRHDRPTVEAFIEVALDLLALADDSDDNPDFRPRSDGLPGDPADHEPGGDDESGAYAEWTSLDHRTRQHGQCLAPEANGHEDDEDCEGGGDDDGSEDSPAFTARDLQIARARGDGAGCPISDPGGCEHDGCEPEEALIVPEYGVDQTLPAYVPAMQASHDRHAARPFLKRAREEACDKRTLYGVTEYVLRH